MSGAFLLDDLAAFFDPEEFADTAVFDGSSAALVGLFEQTFELFAAGGDIATTAPVFVLPSAIVPTDAKGRYLRYGNLLAGGTRWRVANVHELGSGITLLQLHEA